MLNVSTAKITIIIITIIVDIHENVLTTDYIEKCKSGYVFGDGHGSKYKIVYYTYANEWGDKENVIFGRTLNAVMTKYQKATRRLNDEQPDLSGKDDEGHYETTRDLIELVDYIEE